MANGYYTPHLKVNDWVQILSGADWVSLPDPMSLKITKYDLDSEDGSGRNQNGEMLRDRVATKEKLEMTFPPMQRRDYQRILLLTKEQFFKCRYYSDYYQGYREVYMYVGDQSEPLYYALGETDISKVLTQSVSMNFIEK